MDLNNRSEYLTKEALKRSVELTPGRYNTFLSTCLILPTRSALPVSLRNECLPASVPLRRLLCSNQGCQLLSNALLLQEHNCLGSKCGKPLFYYDLSCVLG